MFYMFENDYDDEYYNANVKAVVFIEKDNSITVKFTGFESKEHSAIFSSWLMMLLNVDNAIITDSQSKRIH
jgi:hypothetical protein